MHDVIEFGSQLAWLARYGDIRRDLSWWTLETEAKHVI